MPRSVLGTATRAPSLRVESTVSSPKTTHLSAVQVQQRLRQRRSSRYVDQVRRLDAGTHHHDAAALSELLEAISAEFPELGIDERPLGVVARCQLGPPYEVHICDLGASIIEHYERSRSMPPLFERARPLTAHGGYQFIEVYATTLRAISADGSVAVLTA
jgi:hypothetical protein